MIFRCSSRYHFNSLSTNRHSCQFCGWKRQLAVGNQANNFWQTPNVLKVASWLLARSCQLSADAARNWATLSQSVSFLSLSRTHTVIQQTHSDSHSHSDELSELVYLLVCHTVCHIIWTITNHASVKQTKRAQSIRIRTRTWSHHSSPAFNKNLQANPIFLQGVHSLVDRHFRNDRKRGTI